MSAKSEKSKNEVQKETAELQPAGDLNCVVRGKRGSELYDYDASAEFVLISSDLIHCDRKLRIAGFRTISHYLSEITISNNEKSVTITPRGDNDAAVFVAVSSDENDSEIEFERTTSKNDKNKALNNANRNAGSESSVIQTAVVDAFFPAYKKARSQSVVAQTEKISNLEKYLKSLNLSDEQLAKIAAGEMSVATDESQNEARKSARENAS